MTLLRQARQQWSQWIDAVWLHIDIDFESLRDYLPFQELLRPKG